MSNFDSIQTDELAFLDVGNSSIKLGLRKEDHWEIHAFKDAEPLISTLVDEGIKYLVTCNVRPDLHFLDALSDHFSIAVLETGDIPENQLDYTTPETLGMDRFLACFGAHSLVNSPVVVIDAGSACTIDLMDGNGVFQGGVIMPGIQTLLKVFHNSAPGLPSFNFEIPDSFPGMNSRKSLQWGLSQLFLDGIKENLQRYKREIGEFNLFVTGGDADILLEYLDIDMIHRPDLIFIGMEAFLEE